MNLKSFYRKATAEELELYQQGLYAIQDQAFEIASLYEDKLYLTGGTALSRFYFQHRLSEDLDFFTTSGDLKQIATDFIARWRAKGHELEIERLEIYFARIFLLEKGLKLKIDFAREFNLYGGLRRLESGIFINSLEDLGANKITAFEDRAEMKDILDLYFITKKLSWDDLFRIADTKRMPVPYERLLTINTEGISGRVLTLIDFDEGELAAFVEELKSQTEAQIKKKERDLMNKMPEIVAKILWDFPVEDRKLDQYSLPVLKRRLGKLPLPERRALEKKLVG